MACPYGVRYYNETMGVIEKCTLCAQRLEKGQVPACVEVCVSRCRLFGDLDDPNSEVSLRLKEAGGDVHQLADVGNHPSVYYILSEKIAEWRG
jgi:Fe-S-cluster-containing dehydrogenase component